MRLDKYLSDMGIGTRSESKKYIKNGRVDINGMPVLDPAFHVSDSDIVSFDQTPIVYEEHIYYLMNKPQGVITATKDNSKKTILDLINPEDLRKEIFPVGRLDKDTEGLLLITNDGALAHHLLSPKHHVEKTYYAEVSGIMNEEDITAFAAGLEIDGGDVCLPAKLNILSTSSDSGAGQAISKIEITICEGKYHQIKRMCLSRGHEVLFLKRLSMGPLKLDDSLAPGLYRPLTNDEKNALQNCSAK